MIDLKPYKGQIQAIAGYKAHGIHISGSNDLSHTGDTTATSKVDVVFAANELSVGDVIIIHALISTNSTDQADHAIIALDDITTAGQRIYDEATANFERWNPLIHAYINTTTTAIAMNKFINTGVGASTGAINSITIDTTSTVTVQIGGSLVTDSNTFTVNGYYVQHIKAY